MISDNVVVYLAVGPVDLRGAFDRLAAVTRGVLELDPSSGALFLFINRRKNRVKALWWDKNGWVILYKRLSRGTFQIPKVDERESKHVEISAADFARLVAGLPVSGTKPPHRIVH
jgi:transposase